MIDAIQDYLRGRFKVDKPVALPIGEWETWEDNFKKDRPWAYFFTEGLWDYVNGITYPITRRIKDAKYWVRHRTFDKYHIVHTGLKPDYYDTSVRMLHANFNLLVDYVEIELAWKNVVFDPDKKEKYTFPFFSKGFFRIKNHRSPEAGLDYLQWEKTLVNDENMGYKKGDVEYGTPCSQAQRAMDVESLYFWWKNSFLKRQDPMDLSGWSAFCDRMRDEGKGKLFVADDKMTKEDKQEQRRVLDLCRQIEEQHMKEEEDMLIKLMKIRQGLWS